MSEFLMTTWAGAGNTPPMASVARALVGRGHAVRVLVDELLREDFEATGAEVVAWSRAARTACGRDGDLIADWEPGHPVEQLARLRDRLAVGPAAQYAADTRTELERRRPDVLLCEQMLLGGLVAAQAAGVPAVLLNPTVDVAPAPGRPPFGFGLLPATTPEERVRDRELAAAGLAVWDEALPALNAARAEHGLPPLDHTMDQVGSAARILVLTSAAFDFPADGVPPVVRVCGPRLDDAAWAGGDWAAPEGDAPLVLVALSSDYQAQEQALQRIADALATLPVRALVTTGQGIDPTTVRAGANTRVVRAAAHREVLREAALCVTHCGHGTTLKALAAGVPVVGVPLGRDQHDIAARVVHAGAGERVDPTAGPEAIAAAVRRVLATDSYREAAERLAAAIAEETATDRVVDELEALVAVAA
ncbi:MAG TPA: glycosyltransferase [Baekduia sp.]|nr:glycosyltransferase [Baekduia sp.]